MAVDPNNISNYPILTPQQLLELVLGLIIDNNIKAVTPAKVRQVLIPIIASYAGRNANLSGTAPINYNQFTGVISMIRASASQSGYLHKDDFVAFSAGGSNTPLGFLETRVFKKAEGNTGGFTKEEGDWVYGEPEAGVYWLWAIVGSDPDDYSTYEVKSSL